MGRVASEMKKPSAKTILLGISGGIAAYKAVEVASRLRQSGHEVHVAMSEAATQFVTPLTFAAISGNRVLSEVFPDPEARSGTELYPHLYPATQADFFVLAPATANMIARIAQARGSDMVSLCALSLPAHCRRYFCPAMNADMWEQVSVQDAVRVLESRGWIRLGPETGALACGAEGAGRMMEPTAILSHLAAALETGESLRGVHMLVTSGPTHEYFDPVRYIGNASSGRMGKALAEAAADRGATVTFVTGPVQADLLPRRTGIDVRPVVNAAEMLATAEEAFRMSQIAIFAAAVADYRPKDYDPHKQAKQTGGRVLQLEPTPDIAALLGAQKQPGQRTIGFALQSGKGRTEAAGKLKEKSFDGILLNHPEAMGADSAEYVWIIPDTEPDRWGQLSKTACAQRIMNQVTQWIQNNGLTTG